MNRRETVILTIAGSAALMIVAILVWTDSPPVPFVARQIGLGPMQRKFRSITDDMTRAEVEAILGEDYGISLLGGSLSTCEQHEYIWHGDDGRIFIYFARNPNDRNTLRGPPGLSNQIKRKYFQPSGTLQKWLSKI